jgi:hypothetical protein
MIIMTDKKTSSGKPVVVGKFYEVKYAWGKSYEYGYSWINPVELSTNVDIICHHGGVTYQAIENVIFIRQIKQ